MNKQEVDNLAYLAYVADMQAEGDPMIAPRFEQVSERYQNRYRAIVQAIVPQQEKMLEASIILALRNLPLSVQITPRNGAYVFQVLEKNGTRATLAEAIEAGVTSLISNLAGKGSVFEYSDLKAQYGSPDNRESL